MSHDISSAVVTDSGRLLCEQMTKEVFAASDKSHVASEDAWPATAEKYGLRWNLGSGNRVVGGLPETYNGQSVVDGPHQYVIKISLSTDPPPGELMPNYIEAIIWEQAVDKELAHLFTPIIAYDSEYRWIVMEEVEVLGKDFWDGCGPVPYLDTWEEFDSQYQEFKEGLSEIPGEYGGEAGVNHSGSVVAVDYEHFLGSEWAGMFDREKMRCVTFADIGRRDRSDDTALSGH
ncbi:hypothetical protein [Halococcus sp. AFM35]|uniref:hypothetical protein n=1 Tax=Halococcus sp. AFM35 TaxID=3421653 RepID=UPI003EBEFD04